jgi:hypothetical protein
MIVCASVAIALERCYPDHRVLGERELRCLERDRGAPLASAVLGTGPQGVPALHRPDLVLWPQEQGARPIAVEVELTVKAPRRLAQICRSWARCRGVRGVLYLAAPAARRAVERAVAHVHAADRVFVLALEDLPGAGFIGVEAGQPEKRECR